MYFLLKYFKDKYGRIGASWVKFKKNWWSNQLTFGWSKTQRFNEWKI